MASRRLRYSLISFTSLQLSLLKILVKTQNEAVVVVVVMLVVVEDIGTEVVVVDVTIEVVVDDICVVVDELVWDSV